MVSQERIGSPEALVIYFASITYHLQKAFPINHSQSPPFCLVTQQEGAVRYKTKRLHGPGDQSLRPRSADYCVVTKGASPQRN